VISLTGPAALGNPHHIGIIVPDLDAALEEMAGIGGGWLRLRPRDPLDPSRADPGLRLLPDTARVRLAAAYSRLGPMHLELLEGVPDSPWAPEDRAYIHHLGYWIPAERLQQRSAELEQLGFPLLATRVSGGGIGLIGVYHAAPGGLRVELVCWGSPDDLAAPPGGSR
jgi:Glyoxalase/Bleomycin resistance protein/Dioxygenase superfamily